VYEPGGLGDCTPTESGKAIIFGQMLIFWAEANSQNEKNVYLLNEKNGIHSVHRDEVPEIRDFY